MISDLLGYVCQIVRVDTNAMSADQARTKWQEIPFSTRSIQHLLGIQAEPIEDHCQFVDQCDVYVALGVLDHLGCFCNPNTGHRVRAGRDNTRVQSIYQACSYIRGSGSNFSNCGQPVILVSGVDSLGTVAGKKVLIKFQS